MSNAYIYTRLLAKSIFCELCRYISHIQNLNKVSMQPPEMGRIWGKCKCNFKCFCVQHFWILLNSPTTATKRFACKSTEMQSLGWTQTCFCSNVMHSLTPVLWSPEKLCICIHLQNYSILLKWFCLQNTRQRKCFASKHKYLCVNNIHLQNFWVPERYFVFAKPLKYNFPSLLIL